MPEVKVSFPYQHQENEVVKPHKIAIDLCRAFGQITSDFQGEGKEKCEK
jgi:hypothetical protein